jgi:hypothetical protein
MYFGKLFCPQNFNCYSKVDNGNTGSTKEILDDAGADEESPGGKGRKGCLILLCEFLEMHKCCFGFGGVDIYTRSECICQSVCQQI